jgi:hypothetical protein
MGRAFLAARAAKGVSLVEKRATIAPETQAAMSPLGVIGTTIAWRERGGTMASGGDDKRHSKRVAYPCEARYSGGAEDWQAVRLSDVSVEGAFVDTIIELPVGTKLRLTFDLAGTRIDVMTEVMHSMPQFGMGVRFLNLSPEALSAIEKRVLSEA